MKIILIAALMTGACMGQGLCGTPETHGDVTVSCAYMPYKALASALPGALSTAVSDAVQVYITSPDDGAIAYRVTVRVQGAADSVAIVVRTVPFTLLEVPVPTIGTPLTVRVEKLRPEFGLEFTGGQ